MGHGHLVGLEQNVARHPLVHVEILLLLQFAQSLAFHTRIGLVDDALHARRITVFGVEQFVGLRFLEHARLADEALLRRRQIRIHMPCAMEGLALAPLRDGMAGTCGQMTEPTRQHLDRLELGVHAVIDISGEQFVGALAAEHDFDVLRRQCRQEIQRHAARVGIRLIQMPLDARKCSERLLVGQRLGGVVQVDEFGKFSGLLGFVVRPLAEADGIRVLGACDRGHIARIHAAGQERADLHVGDLVGLDRIAYRAVDGVHQRIELGGGFAEMLVVVFVNAHLAVAVGEIMAFRQLEHALEEGLADGRVLEGHVRLERLLVELLDEVRVLQQALDLRGVHERAVHLGIVEGLDAEMIAGAEQFALVPVPDHEGEHASNLLQQFHAPLLIAMQQHLGVAFGGEGVSGRDQFLTQRLIVVDLAVEGDDLRAILVVDGLLAAAEVDDAEPSMAERRVLVDVMAFAVRPAMRDHVGHTLEDRAFHVNGHIVDETSNSAHYLQSLQNKLGVSVPASACRKTAAAPPNRFMRDNLHRFQTF